MDPVTLALIMGGSGLAKSELIDTPAARQKALLEAEKTRYSPWTGMRGEDAQYKSSLDQGIGMAMGGAKFGQDLDRYEAETAALNRTPYFPSGYQSAQPRYTLLNASELGQMKY